MIAIGRHSTPSPAGSRCKPSAGKPAGIHVQVGRFSDTFDSVDLLVTTVQPRPAQPQCPAADPADHRPPKDVLAAAPAALRPPLQDSRQAPHRRAGRWAGQSDQFRRRGRCAPGARGTSLCCRPTKGTLLVATPPRTPVGVLAGAAKLICRPPTARSSSNRAPGVGTPYPALLALADAFIVTSGQRLYVAVRR